ncbi:ATP-binding protein [uncultured Zobellia sp.]|uniref:ATP-binding protein n=1 Tax=uncultured Zobellia sp. TaxID=255433 RepID=UPI0025935774|nr:ATP-binding protein [uncultured Zobellia sp.]
MRKIKLNKKRHNQARFRYQLKRRKWKKKTRKRRGSSKQQRTRAPEYIDLVAPVKFTLEPENVKEVLEYIEAVKKIGREKKDVNFILKDVEEIGIGAISMLISVMNELEERNVVFKGTKPKKDKPKNILEKSGFMNFVVGKVREQNRTTRNIIFTTGKINTHQKNIVNAIHKANLTVWGEDGRSPLLYGTIVEMIKNSCKHAFKIEDKVKWHIAVNHDEKNNKVKFSFVDNGIGIIKSFEKEDLMKIFGGYFRNNAEFIDAAYNSGIESKTGKAWRGTGLPTIYETFSDKIIKKLVVITNNVYCDFETNKKFTLKEPFSGTYYYWEMDKGCVKHCFK